MIGGWSHGADDPRSPGWPVFGALGVGRCEPEPAGGAGLPEVGAAGGTPPRTGAGAVVEGTPPLGAAGRTGSAGTGFTIGSVVTAIANEATGKLVDILAHRFMPAGVAVILQNQLPFPDSGVSNCWEQHSVVDSMVIDWPQIGFTYDVSSYSLQTLAGRAPAWSGVLTNIVA